MNALKFLRRFLDKDYRDGYLRTQVGSGVAYQIQALRSKLGLTQTQFARLIGKPQTVVSRLENGTGNVSVETLLDVATGTGVALLVQFVSYPEMLRRTEDMTESALKPDTIHESVDRLENGGGWGLPDRPSPTKGMLRLRETKSQVGEQDLLSLLGGAPQPFQGGGLSNVLPSDATVH